MKQTLLSFPNAGSIAAFVLQHTIAPAEINSQERTLSAYLEEKLISIACSQYQAKIMHPGLVIPITVKGRKQASVQQEMGILVNMVDVTLPQVQTL
jgi:hypothetical protein